MGRYDHLLQAKPRMPTPEEDAARTPHSNGGEILNGHDHRHRHNPAKQGEKQTSVGGAPPEPFRPFPVDALPEPLRGFAIAAARAIGCDVAFLAVPLLVMAGACVGNARSIRLKRGWMEPPILWAAIIAESGEHKSPALELALRPLRRLQRTRLKEHDVEMGAWLADMQEHDKRMADWKKGKTDGPAPEPPTPPPAIRYVTDDATIEALAALLKDQPRGLLCAMDELAAWLGGFQRYKGKGGGSDLPKWLEMFHGRMVLIDRKTGLPRTICIPRASVSVVGGIQPGILKRALQQEHREAGLTARLLMAWPPRRPRRWTDAEIDPRAEAVLAELVGRLLDMEMGTDDDDDPCPQVLDLTPEAKRLFKAFFDEHADEQSAMTGELCAAWSKLEAYAPRLALVHHCVRWAAGDSTVTGAVDAVSMAAGIDLARWFGHEARRVYTLCSETEDQRERRELVEWIDRRGGVVTPRDLQRALQRYRLPGTAEAALNDLVQAGIGQWALDTDTGGAPRREFVLFHRHNPTEPSGLLTSVGVGSDEQPEIAISERLLTEQEVDDINELFDREQP